MLHGHKGLTDDYVTVRILLHQDLHYGQAGRAVTEVDQQILSLWLHKCFSQPSVASIIREG